jgi:DNA-binding PadR family transcriptional regulator
MVYSGLSMASRDLSGGDYLFLAFLARGPASAYDLKKEMASSVNFFWSAQHSQVYQQATRLQRDGFIEQRGEPAGRMRRMLGLTSKGEEALRGWLAAPAPTYRIYDESLAKLFFAGLSTPRAARALLVDQQEQHAGLLAEFERIAAVLEGVDYGDNVPGSLYTLRLGIEVERGYLRWIGETLEDLDGRTPGVDAAERTANG